MLQAGVFESSSRPPAAATILAAQALPTKAQRFGAMASSLVSLKCKNWSQRQEEYFELLRLEKQQVSRGLEDVVLVLWHQLFGLRLSQRNLHGSRQVVREDVVEHHLRGVRCPLFEPEDDFRVLERLQDQRFQLREALGVNEPQEVVDEVDPNIGKNRMLLRVDLRDELVAVHHDLEKVLRRKSFRRRE